MIKFKSKTTMYRDKNVLSAQQGLVIEQKFTDAHGNSVPNIIPDRLVVIPYEDLSNLASFLEDAMVKLDVGSLDIVEIPDGL